MKNQIKIILLHGFRATGKSTLGEKVAKKISWQYKEMDKEIEKEAGKPIANITRQGTQWQKFRQMEQDVLKKILEQEKIVVSTGGGVCVNNIIKKGTKKTFGHLNTQIVKEKEDYVFSILITANSQILRQRIQNHEMKKHETTRPILDERKAKEIQQKLKKYKNNPKKQKQILIEEIVSDSMKMYKKRKNLYEQITDYIVDTSNKSIEESVKQIVQMYKNLNYKTN